MPDDDPVEKLARDIAAKHVARSIDEMRDPAKVAEWADGPRAEQFSVSELETALSEILEPKTEEKPNE